MFEKVNPGHPDKVADRIAGAVVDLAYTKAASKREECDARIGTSEREQARRSQSRQKSAKPIATEVGKANQQQGELNRPLIDRKAAIVPELTASLPSVKRWGTSWTTLKRNNGFEKSKHTDWAGASETVLPFFLLVNLCALNAGSVETKRLNNGR